MANTKVSMRPDMFQGTKDKNFLIEGTLVEANPELAGTEATLTGLKVDDTKYKVPEATPVEANPVLAGTEAELTGLQVGDTKYKMPSGGSEAHLYEHTVELLTIKDQVAYSAFVKLYSASSDEINNYTKLKDAVISGSSTDGAFGKNIAYGQVVVSSYGNNVFDVLSCGTSATKIFLTVSNNGIFNPDFSASDFESITDTVTQIF